MNLAYLITLLFLSFLLSKRNISADSYYGFQAGLVQ